ncbi:MAG: fused MFS/spermidine synthase [Anaerolineae bacterium]|nr:fused MFS/spermidine synthase [Anaerolineae bacterium]
MSEKQRRYLYVVVFTSGLLSLGLELSASRLLGTVFGTSNIVWANIIGLILLYLTAGYFIGGRLADRSPYVETFYRVVLWGAFSAGLIPALARPVLRVAAGSVFNINAAVLVGSFGVMMILFAVPVTLLGIVSPFAIRLAIEDASGAGGISGRMYAISTIGSIIGTFLPVLVLIPTIGTNLTFMLLSGLLLVVGLTGYGVVDWKKMLRYAWMPVVHILLAIFALPGTLRPVPEGMILLHEDESAYNYIQVVRWGEANILFLNEGQGIHSMYFPDYPDYIETGGTWDYYLAAPFFNAPPHTPADVTSMAMVGLAAGTVPKQYTQVFGPIPVDGIEIDPDIVQAGRDYFDMDEPNLNVIVQDGRYALAASDKTYDVVGVDAYRLPYIPWHLTTVEFFQEIREHLSERGVLAINVGRTVDDRRLIEAFSATLGQVFPSVHVIDVPHTCNSILVATVQPTVPENLIANRDLLGADVQPVLPKVLTTAYEQIRPTPTGGRIMTDDRAPTELMTDLLVVNFVLSGGNELPCQ